MQSQRLLSETAKIEVMLYARFYRRLKSPPHRMRRRFGAATSVAESISEFIRLTIALKRRSPSTWSRDFSRGFNTKVHTGLPSPCIIKVHLPRAATLVAGSALESIKLAIEMESESPSAICTGLKPSTSLGFGLYLSMAKFRPCSIQGSNGD